MAPLPTAALLALVLLAFIPGQDPAPSPEPPGPYGLERDHPFQRLHRALFHRRDGAGGLHGELELDPLLFPRSVWPLEDDRERELGAALQELIGAGAASAPLMRLVLQRDVWALHDWAAERAQGRGRDAESARRLRDRSARAMRVLALQPEELAAANAAARGLLAREEQGLRELLLSQDGRGPWIALMDLDRPERALASAHVSHFGARSTFEVHLRLPSGRAAGEEYLAQLRAHPLSTRSQNGIFLPSDLLQPPPGTRVALVRRAVHVTAAGTAAPSELVELVQLRTFPRTDALVWSLDPEGPATDPFAPQFWAEYQTGEEFELDRAAAFAGRRALRAVSPDELLLSSFGTHGEDPLARPGPPTPFPRGASCFSCHGAIGLHSMPSFTGIASGPGTHHVFPFPLPEPPRRLGPAAGAERRVPQGLPARGLPSEGWERGDG